MLLARINQLYWLVTMVANPSVGTSMATTPFGLPLILLIASKPGEYHHNRMIGHTQL
jgi:hypothetical protein